MKKNIYNLYYLGIILLLSSCMVSKKPLQIPASTDVCLVSESAHIYDSLLANIRPNYDTTGTYQTINQRFSLRTTNMSKNIGAYDLLCQYAKLEKNSQQNTISLEDKLAFLTVKQELNQQINVANADITNILAELDCEKARILEAKSYLENWIAGRVNKLTVGSIFTGALGGILTGVIALLKPDDSNTEQQVVAIGGAAISAYLGMEAVVVKKKIKFYHARNYLQDFVDKPKYSRIYAPTVWNFVSKEFNKSGKTTSGCEIVLQKWQILGLLDVANKKQATQNKLLLGNGGNYTTDELQARLDMLDIIAEEIDLTKYDLKRIQQELLLGYKLN